MFPQVRRAFQVTRCNQCEDAPCVAACPTQAMFRREDGIVDFDKGICIGCKACMAACPYDAIFINPEDHSAEKCNMCAHRLDVGLEPACVTVCPTEAILVGDLNDPAAKVTQVINREPVQVRQPEKDTRPGVFYKGAHRPRWTRWPRGGPTAACSPGPPRALPDPQLVTSGHPGRTVSSAAALLSYDVPHHAPWGWRVSLYTWTKSVAAGAFAVPAALAFAGLLPWGNAAVRWAAPRAGAGVPGPHRRPAGRRPEAPGAVLPDLHPASLAQLAGARGVHPGRVRRHRGRRTCWRRWPARPGPGRCWPRSGCRWPPPPRSTPRTCSRRPRRATCGRARCSRRTWRCRPRWRARRRCCRCWPGWRRGAR